MITQHSFMRFAAVALSTSLLAACSDLAEPDENQDKSFNVDELAAINVTRLTVAGLLKKYADGKYDAKSVVQAYQARINTYEPHYNAFTFMNPSAVDEAEKIDKKRDDKESLGPLAGVPIVVKESMDFVGYRSTAGWHELCSLAGGTDLYPAQNSVIVQRLIDADAIILGKTNIPAFSDDGTRANSSWAGPTYNTIDKDLVPGASSSGTATAVAGAFAPAGVGEETGGSIQNPAGAQHLVSVKVTFGLIPTTGVVPLAASTRDVLGPLTTTVRDAAIVLDVIAGSSPSDPSSAEADAHIPAGGYTCLLSETALQGKRIGLYGPGWRSIPLSTETNTLYQGAISELVAQGAVVVTDPFAGSGFAALALPNEPYDYRGTESAAYDYQRYLPGLGVPSIAALKNMIGVSPFDPGQPLYWYVQALPELQASLLNPAVPPDLTSFNTLKANYLTTFNQVMTAHNLDALVFPQTTDPIPTMASGEFISETTVSAINIAGVPGVTVPGGEYASGAPFSLIFVGRKWTEAELLAYAYDYEQATHHRIFPVLTTQ